MKTSENNPADWLRSARTRLQSADSLHPLEGANESVIELLHEAAERYLKAYLIACGWKLRRIHDLGALVAESRGSGPTIQRVRGLRGRSDESILGTALPRR
ncbi:MAG: HEPN domain-containing protein [Verrucomicrobiales bacterium]|nr:HEPN domain-containing protein [Verrucomicrobiales bacterium]